MSHTSHPAPSALPGSVPNVSQWYPGLPVPPAIPAPTQTQYIVFNFPNKAFSGPMVDPHGQTVYTLHTEESSFSTKPTAVARADGTPVGELAWEGLTHTEKVTLNGKIYGDKELMQRKKEGLGSRSKWAFKDDAGREYIWDGLMLYDSAGMLVAHYQCAIHHTFWKDEPANLQVSSAHLYMLDMILFTALWMEHRRAKKEKSKEVATISIIPSLNAGS